MLPGIADARRPYITFKTRAIEDREATVRTGIYTTKDEDFVFVTPAGSKDVIERVYAEWIENQRLQADQGRIDPSWVRKYSEEYKEWKAGREIPVDGTPLMNWPAISPSQRENCLKMNIRTVEDLAVANEEALGYLGMGGRALKDLAKNWLQSAKGEGGALASQLTAANQRIEALAATNDALAAQVRELAAQLKQIQAENTSAKLPSAFLPSPASRLEQDAVEDLIS